MRHCVRNNVFCFMLKHFQKMCAVLTVWEGLYIHVLGSWHASAQSYFSHVGNWEYFAPQNRNRNSLFHMDAKLHVSYPLSCGLPFIQSHCSFMKLCSFFSLLFGVYSGNFPAINCAEAFKMLPSVCCLYREVGELYVTSPIPPPSVFHSCVSRNNWDSQKSWLRVNKYN